MTEWKDMLKKVNRITITYKINKSSATAEDGRPYESS